MTIYRYVFVAVNKNMCIQTSLYIQMYLYHSNISITATLGTDLVVSQKIIRTVGLVVKCLLIVYTILTHV